MAVGSLYGKDERNTVGADSSVAEHQPESQPGVDGSLPGPEGLCRICRSGAEICQRTALVRGSGTCHHRVYPGRGSERISGEEPGGGEENEYIRIRSGKTYPNGEAGGLGEDQDRVRELAEKPTQ